MKSDLKRGLSFASAILFGLMPCFVWQAGWSAVTNRSSSIPPLPPSLPNSPSTNYFYVTAYGWGESLPSNTVESTNLPVTLAWDPSPDTSVSGYLLYWSQDKTSWKQVSDAGTNLTVTWPIVLTNRIFEIRTRWIATNPPTQFYSLCIKTNLNGPWTPLDNAPKTVIVTPF